MSELEQDERPTIPEREGLPPSYRMRADAHYVDQLSARSSDVPLRLIPVADIDEGETSPPLDTSRLSPLVQSIVEHGIVQPLLVRREGDRYPLIAGRKRLAAARAASIARVPCLVYSADDVHAEELARAADVRADAPKIPSPAHLRSTSLDAEVIGRVSEAVTTIQSAVGLLGDDGSPMLRRVALDLVRAGAWKASWQLRAATILEHTHRWHFRPLLLGAVLTRVRDGFAAEGRLRGIDLKLTVVDWNASADLDEEALVCGVSGAVVASAGLADVSEGPQVTVIARRPEGKVLTIDIKQDATAPDAGVASRFFDATWSARPGGESAMIGAAAAREVAERHGGEAALIAGAGRGSTVRLTFHQR